MRHADAFELLAPLSLDAVDGAELAELTTHVSGCARCQAELASLREVAGALGTVAVAPPDGLWSSVVERLYGDETPPRLDLTRARATSRAARWTPWLSAAAALVAVVVLSVLLVGADHRAGGPAHALGGSDAQAALATPGHRVVTLMTAGHVVAARFVTVPDGRAYLLSSSMAALPSTETYQLWDVSHGTPVSLGLLGPDPRHAVAMLPSGAGRSTLAVTVEPSGGSVRPTTPVVASAPV